MSFKEIGQNVSISEKAWNASTQEIFSPDLIGLIRELHLKFEPRRIQLLKEREERQANWDAGELPTYLDKNSEAIKGNWRIQNIPEDYQTRRVEITGPVNDAKMVINMLSRNSEGFRADTAMLDFEDSMKPSFENVINGYKNVLGAAIGHLSYTKPATNKSPAKSYQINPEDMAGLMVRVRGLHLTETNIRVNNQPVHAGLLDLAVCFYLTARKLLSRNKTPKYYIPKCEHHLEARWWNEAFCAIETSLGFKIPTLRATFLIETLPAAFQVEEILYETKEHIIGLNVGRWDKIFSDIKVLGKHADRISPDRAEINMSKHWMDNYAKRLIKICHSRGAYAIGGMSAFTPGKDADTREAQTQKVKADKQNEFDIGHDGCWVSHPYFIGHAMGAFTKSNQLERTLPDFDKNPDLLMDGKGKRTMGGLRTNLRVGIAYLEGWNKDLGCVSWDNMMEDLATLEISRAQVWQWLYHGITLDSGEVVTKEIINKIFTEELDTINNEIKVNLKEADSKILNTTLDSFKKAKDDAQSLFTKTELADFLSTQSNLY